MREFEQKIDCLAFVSTLLFVECYLKIVYGQKKLAGASAIEQCPETASETINETKEEVAKQFFLPFCLVLTKGFHYCKVSNLIYLCHCKQWQTLTNEVLNEILA